jgi:O-antigen ligase
VSIFLNWLGNNKQERYFSFSLFFFVFSYLLLPSTKMVNNTFYVLLAIPALIFFICGKWKDFIRRPTSSFFLAFVGWLVVVGALSGDFQYFRHIIYVFLFMVVLVVLINPSPFNDSRFFRVLFWGVCIYIVGSAIVYWANGTYPLGERIYWLPSRLTGTTYPAVWVAACLGLVVPTWLRERRWAEGGIGLFLAFFAVSFVMQTRAGLVGIFVLMFIFLVEGMFRNKYKAFAFLLMAITFGSALLLLKEVPGINRLFAVGASFRPEIWSSVISDLLGCGILFGCGVNYDYSIIVSNGSLANHPHNVYLSIALYSGVLSMILFFLWMTRVIMLAYKHKNQWGLYLFLSLCMLLFDGSFPINHPNEFWLLVLLPAGLITSQYFNDVNKLEYTCCR